VPFLLDGFADDLDLFQADRIHPGERAQARMLDTVWTQAGAAAAPVEALNMLRTTIGCEEAVGRYDAFDTIVDVRSPSEFAPRSLPARSIARCSTMRRSERRWERCTSSTRPSPPKRHGARWFARNIARHHGAAVRRQAAHWRPTRLLLARAGSRSGRDGARAVGDPGPAPSLEADIARSAPRRRELEGLPRRFRLRIAAGRPAAARAGCCATYCVRCAGLELEQDRRHRRSVAPRLAAPTHRRKQVRRRAMVGAARLRSSATGDRRVGEAARWGSCACRCANEHMRDSDCVHLQVPTGPGAAAREDTRIPRRRAGR